MRTIIKRTRDRISEYNRIANIGVIARRYLVMNSFDGVLTIIGVLVGAFLVGLTDVKTILGASLGVGIAMGVSGIWGTYLTENAERQKELKELEKIMMIKLHETKIGRAAKMAAIIVALVNGLAPMIAVVIAVLPFFFVSVATKSIYFISFGISFIILFLLGVFLGTISKESMIKSGIKMIVAGIVCVILSLVIVSKAV